MECPGPEGTVFYTNKERPNCQPKALQAPSPSLPSFAASTAPAFHRQFPSQQSPATNDFAYDAPIGAFTKLLADSDSGRDWYKANAGNGSVQTEVCSMYAEWLHLNQNTAGDTSSEQIHVLRRQPNRPNWYAQLLLLRQCPLSGAL